MNKHPRVVFASIFLGISILACGLPGGQDQPSATKDAPSSDQVATVVASTLQALTQVSPDVETPAPTADELLPHSLYFLNNDNAGIAQVFRLETDGTTTTQITFEPTAVNSYDVSLVDGSVVYVSNNQLLLINADGSGRRMLVDGGAVDSGYEYSEGINSPTFSPNAQTIAYGHKGLVLYAVSTGVSNVVLEQLVTDPLTGRLTPGEIYVPQIYSPDGTKLLITVAIPNSDGISSGVYYPAAGSLVRISGGDGALTCCGEQGWASDSSALYVGISFVGMLQSGLWRVDAASGDMTTLLPFETSGNYNLASHPYLAPDGQLYFFFATRPAEEFISRAPLQIVRAAPDGVTGRTVLLPETFQLMNEALWAPDASFVITAIAPSDQIYQGGVLELYYTHAEAGMLTLAPFGQQLKWGP
jgi:hypothetical protein